MKICPSCFRDYQKHQRIKKRLTRKWERESKAQDRFLSILAGKDSPTGETTEKVTLYRIEGRDVFVLLWESDLGYQVESVSPDPRHRGYFVRTIGRILPDATTA